MLCSGDIAQRILRRLRPDVGDWVMRAEIFHAIDIRNSNDGRRDFRIAIRLLRESGWAIEEMYPGWFRLASLERATSRIVERNPYSALDRLKRFFLDIPTGEIRTTSEIVSGVYRDPDDEPEWSTSIVGVLIHKARMDGFPIVYRRGYALAPRR